MEQPLQPQTEAVMQVERPDGAFSLGNPDSRTETLQNAEEVAAVVLETQLQHHTAHTDREGWMGVILPVMFLGTVLIISLPLLKNDTMLEVSILACCCLFEIGGVVLWVWLNRLTGIRERALLDAVSQIHDKKHVGLLVRALSSPASVRNIAIAHLRLLLPTLHKDDVALLGKSERQTLRWYLSEVRSETKLHLAILKGMEQIGDEQDLPVIRRLARTPPKFSSVTPVPREVRIAAAACVLTLEAGLKEQQIGEQLLRASIAPASFGAELLRPATESASTPPEQLLRASEPQS